MVKRYQGCHSKSGREPDYGVIQGLFLMLPRKSTRDTIFLPVKHSILPFLIGGLPDGCTLWGGL